MPGPCAYPRAGLAMATASANTVRTHILSLRYLSTCLLSAGCGLPLHPDGAHIDEWAVAFRDLGAYAKVHGRCHERGPFQSDLRALDSERRRLPMMRVETT